MAVFEEAAILHRRQEIAQPAKIGLEPAVELVEEHQRDAARQPLVAHQVECRVQIGQIGELRQVEFQFLQPAPRRRLPRNLRCHLFHSERLAGAGRAEHADGDRLRLRGGQVFAQ